MLRQLIPVPQTLTSLPSSRSYRGLTLVLTFLSYTSYHLSRKPISIVKVGSISPLLWGQGTWRGSTSISPLSLSLQSQLHPNCSTLGPNPHNDSNNTNWCSWAPFGKAEPPQVPKNYPKKWQPSQVPPLIP